MVDTASLRLTTRLSDLDSQGTLSLRACDQLAAEARELVLAAQGSGFSTQPPGAGVELKSSVQVFPAAEGGVIWDHRLEAADGAEICRFLLRTQSLDRNGEPLDLFTDARDLADSALLAAPAPFQGGCKQVQSAQMALFTDRDALGDHPVESLWRIFDEGRWRFAARIGLTEEMIRRLDTDLPLVGGVYEFRRPPRPGRELQLLAWVERIDRVRVFLRQEVYDPADGQLMLSAREEHTIVSLSKGRPRTPPVEYLELLADYVERPAEAE
jgi:acyl-CoA thioesterase FadM